MHNERPGFNVESEWAVKDRLFKRAFLFYMELGEILDSFRLRDPKQRVDGAEFSGELAPEVLYTPERKQEIEKEICKLNRSSTVGEMLDFLKGGGV